MSYRQRAGQVARTGTPPNPSPMQDISAQGRRRRLGAQDRAADQGVDPNARRITPKDTLGSLTRLRAARAAR